MDRRKKVRAYGIAFCIESNSPIYEAGRVYPMVGWNNGNHIIGVTEHGFVYDGIALNEGDYLVMQTLDGNVVFKEVKEIVTYG